MNRPRFGYFYGVEQRRLEKLRVVDAGAATPATPASDDAILEAFARRDRKAAGLLYDRLLGVVDATLYRVVGRREADHEDLVQSTFEQIIVTLSRRSFAGGCSLTGWAASIACHVGLNAIRSRSRTRRVFAVETDGGLEAGLHPAHQNPEAQAMARRELDRIRRCLASMDPGRAEAVMLIDVFDLSLSETARLAGVTLSAAQSRLVRGRRELRQRLTEEDAP